MVRIPSTRFVSETSLLKDLITTIDEACFVCDSHAIFFGSVHPKMQKKHVETIQF